MESEQMLNLHEAAVQGNVATLSELLEKDPLILDKFLMCCPSETPLHIATWLGHVDFVRETLRRKPELASELDSRRSSSLHVASLKGYVDIVKVLLEYDSNMCFAHDVERRNPLHLATMKGRTDILKELIRAKPAAARATTNYGESLLHLCIKHGQLEALMFLVDCVDDSQFLNAEDDYGITVLHLAVATKQIEVVKFLTLDPKIEANAMDRNGFTALDILTQSIRDVKDWEIGELLRRIGTVSSKDAHFSRNGSGITIQNQSLESYNTNLHNITDRKFVKEDDWLKQHSKTLMVVASLIATMAFEAGSNPPSGTWQDDSAPTKTKNSDMFINSPETPYNHTAGYPTMASYDSLDYNIFIGLNTTSFVASLSIILLLISGLPTRRKLFIWILMVIMWIAVAATALIYLTIVFNQKALNNAGAYIIKSITFTCLSLMGIVVLMHIGRCIRKRRNLKKLLRRQGREIPVVPEV